jgi:hypothetical protein
MNARNSLILVCLAATAFVALSACSGSGGAGGDDDDGGSFGAFEGPYTLSYFRVQANSNCTDEDPDWVQGILIIEGGTFDFGGTYQVAADLTGDTYTFDGDLTDPAGLIHVSGTGTFVESTGGTILIVGGDDDGIVADYDTECRVRGTYTGAKTVSSFGPA